MTDEKTTGEKQSRGEVLTGDIRRERVECWDLSESASFYSALRRPANSPNAAAPGTCCRALLEAQETTYLYISPREPP